MSSLLALLLLAGAAHAQAPAAPEWNPKPAEGDLVLPLPCDTGIAFRRFGVPLRRGGGLGLRGAREEEEGE